MADRPDSTAAPLAPALESRVDATSPRFEANMRFLADLVNMGIKIPGSYFDPSQPL